LGRLFPAERDLAADYGRSLAQRNEALRRVRAGSSTLAAVAPWTESVAQLGARLDAARAELVRLLAPGFAVRAAELGLEEATIAYEPDPPSVALLEARLTSDVARGLTGAGPHLRDVALAFRGRDLRGFGSQGEQRAAVLALVLAEAELSCERRASPPLLLLDDVLSELDEHRRLALLASLPADGQSVITATSRSALPRGAPEPALVVRVQPGEAVAA
ncbi:MAG: DNA replication/repair protein RecF, partial [Thermoleophilia bacterium]|nr:DNA replication/repair protein RecF [Thermoleophilia bacterium]